MEIQAALLRETGAKTPYAASKPLEIASVKLDPPGPGEVLVKIRAAGLCHSDLSVINGDRPRPLPMVLGHESSGIVVGVGEFVTSVQPDDHVVMVFMPSCGQCMPCSIGRPALCGPGAKANGDGTLLTGERRLHCEGTTVNHHLGVSGFAEYAVVSEHSVVKVDKTIPFDEAALFGCAVLTGVGAVVNTAKLRVGDSAAVIGLGGVGLSAVLGAVAAGARQVVAIDLSNDKLALAKELGATDVVNSRDEEAVSKILDLTHGGVDYAFEMAGAVKAMELACQITKIGGTTVTAGLPPPGSELAVPLVPLVGQERTIKGSYIGTCVPKRDIPAYMALYKAGRLPVDKLMSGKLSLDQINEAFDRLHEGKAVRQIIEFPA